MQSLAQKKARENFKKAIEYRKKTGCTLKQAFAYVKGKSTVIKKKAIPKKVAVKKTAKKKIGVVKKKAAKKPSEKSILSKIHKVKKDVDNLDEAQHKHMMSGIEDKMFKDLYDTRERIANTKKAILKLQTFAKVSPTQKHIFQNKAKQYKKYLIELNTHYRELKKHI
jgi:hypothetical protein